MQEPALANAKFSKIKDPALNQDLIELERKLIPRNYKIGLLYVKEGQTKENEMFANGMRLFWFFSSSLFTSL